MNNLQANLCLLAVTLCWSCEVVMPVLLLITPAVALLYPDVDAALFAIAVVGNGAAFPVLFAMPFMVLMQEELGFEPCA